jgi:hypothetical protein
VEIIRPPEVVREKVSRTAGGRLTCALIFDRELQRDEVMRFYALPGGESPAPTDFEITGRVMRYDCSESDEARWRLAAEIFLVKSYRDVPKPRTRETDARMRLGLRPLQR